jgi:plastocyanin
VTNVTTIPVFVPSYTVTAPTYVVSIAPSGTVGSGGVATGTDGVYSVVNSGRIGNSAANTGVLIYRGGTVINDLGATIAAGGIGVSIGSGYKTRGTHTSFGSVVNNGTILAGTGAGLYLGDNVLQGAFVTNGGTGNTTALISGRDGILDLAGVFSSVDATIRNFGTIQGTGGVGYAGVNMDGTPGTIVNGSSLDSHALITGFIGIDGTGDGDLVVQNFGTIEGTGGEAILLGSPSDTLIAEAGATFIGTVDGAGGTLVLAADAGAGTLTGLGTSFTNFNDVSVASGAAWTLTGVNSIAAGTVLTNNGTLRDAGTLVNGGTIALADYHGLQVAAGGNLTNQVGAVISLTSANYEAYDPVVRGLAGGTSTITNLGTIRNGEIGVYLAGGGTVINGASNDTSALIYAHDGVYNNFNTTMTVVNYGTIVGNYAGADGDHRGVDIATGVVVNGASDSTAAYIVGGNGIDFGAHAGTVVNWGTIRGNYQFADGVQMYYGSGGTVIDGGTIIGSADAIDFNAAVEATRFGSVGNNLVELYTSAVLIGDVVADGTNNRLELSTGAGTGTIASIGRSFQGFATITVDAGASWSIGGDSTLAAGTSLVDFGTLQTTGTMTSSGTLIDAGTLVNEGILVASGEALQVAAGGSLINAGSIAGAPGGVGVDLRGGGVIVNGASGSAAASILGAQYGIFAVNGPTTLTNFGTILASDGGSGFYQGSGVATIFNAGVIGATNGSGVGIDLTDGGTIIDSGAVEGGNTAIRFGGTGSNLLVLEHGYEFFGLIQGSASASNTLELVGSVGAPVTEKYLDVGVGLVDFQTVEFGPGAGNYATLGIRNDTELPATIAGFVGIHDTIDLAALSDTGNNATTSFNSLTDVLTITGDNGSVQLQLANDESYAGIGWVAQNDGNGGTAIHAVNGVPPVIGGTVAGQTTTDEVTDQPFAGVTITDANPSPEAETLTITLTNDGVATDADGTLSGIGLNRTGTGTYMLVASSAAAATAELQALTFTPTAHQVAPGDTVTTGFTISVTDTAGGTSSDSTTTVGVTAVDDPPVVTAGATVNLTGGGAPVVLDSGLTVTDPSGLTLLSATVSIGAGFAAGDMLSFTNNGSSEGNITGSYDTSTGTLTLTSAGGATLAQWQAALESITFSGGSAGPRTISWTVSDAVNSSVAVTSTVDVIVPPQISGTLGGQATPDEATIRPFSGVSITDANSGQTETVTVTLSSPTNGALSNLGGGSYDSATGVYTVTGSDTAVSAAVDGLVFTPTAHQVAAGDTVTTTFTIAVTDTAGGTSSNSITSVTATAVNDPPVIAGTVAGQLMSDVETELPFSRVTITDPDEGAIETVTITLNVDGVPSDANGILSGAGLTETAPGIYTLTAGTPAAVTAALQALVFTPAVLDLPPGSEAVADMTLSVGDGTANAPTTDTTTSVVIVPCFAAGTRIATPRGAVAVERLREGDTVLTVSGKPQRIQWIGCRTLDCNRHISPERVKPIRIAPHAFGENRPRRALLLSPDHSVFVDDVLIPIKHLVNDTTVTQIDVATVTYYHLELPRHDVVLAEGLPAETYLETGARFAFENGGGAMELHPNFAPDEARVGMVWRNFSYAPLIGTDGQLDRVRARLALQALMLDHRADAAPQRRKKRARP